MSENQTTACPACGRAPGMGCGRDEQTPRIGCFLLGGPPPLYRVLWRRKDEDRCTARMGGPMPMLTAQAWAKSRSEVWPEFVHWIEPVEDQPHAK